MNRAVFCDRDGVINVDHGYVHRWDEFDIFSGVPEALSALRQAGWLLVLVTNQSGIARGYYNESDFQVLTDQMQSYLAGFGAQFDAVYFCPHHPQAKVAVYTRLCRCRKPAPGLFEQAKTELNLHMSQSVCIGDNVSDIQAARAAGVGLAYGVGVLERFAGYAPDERFDEPASALQAVLALP